MNKVTFFLARPNSTKPTSVYAQLRVGRGRVKVQSGLSVLPTHWSRQRQRVKGSVRNAAYLNARLDAIADDLVRAVLDLQNRHIEPTPQRVKARFEELVKRDVTLHSERTFLDYFDLWIEHSGNKKTPQTLKLYRSVKEHLRRFSEDRGARLFFDGMDREFINGFTGYLIRVRQLQNSTIWHVLKTWKAFMRWAVENELTTNRIHESVTKKAFNVHESPAVRLSSDELRQLYRADLSEEYLDNVRKLFVLQCYLGVRYGDLRRIVANPSAYMNGDSLRLTTQKNRKPVLIPLLPIARDLLNQSEQLRPISNQKANDYLKEAARRCGLDRQVTTTEFRGTQRTEQTQPLHALITTHAAKHTFVSLMAANGVNREVIKAITGNSNATLDRYLELDEGEIRREMERAAMLLPTT